MDRQLEVVAERQIRGTQATVRGRAFSDLLIFVSHHVQRNVLRHVVQLICEAVGAGNVDGGAVMIPPDCNEMDISYTP